MSTFALSGRDSESEWLVEIETDRFTDVDPFVVSLFCRVKDEGGTDETLATPSPEQAREIAAALLKVADNTEANNRRVGRTTSPGGDTE